MEGSAAALDVGGTGWAVGGEGAEEALGAVSDIAASGRVLDGSVQAAIAMVTAVSVMNEDRQGCFGMRTNHRCVLRRAFLGG
ncbi:MAG TPA: hypothetical protein PLJ27_04435 [Polyangiaceae bacterium]|nr:MAG: hypothetical protein BWY17_01381 [Deltaproteobacteria bacterium ADurb.Bin207]HQB43335.1 hypothetical protein [Polyangiaceae bacterium]HQK16679.1 hypothetical protein [Polyangiaceae bacterium]